MKGGGSNIEQLRRREQGMTLVELAVVLTIIALLVATAAISVVELINLGEAEGYGADERTIQLVVTTFYADAHAFDSANGWNEAGNSTAVHSYPTGNASDSILYPGYAVNIGGYVVREVWSAANIRATTDEVRAAAIWMGLLVNSPGSGVAGPDMAPGDANSPLANERGPYLNEVPRSSSENNFSGGKGSYTWIVGGYGRAYGVFEQDGVWYAGYNGSYP